MPKKVYEPVGHHYIVEASGCNAKVIGSVEKVQDILVKAAEIAGAKVWAISFSKFPPSGVSGVVVISESHISTHTWPEHRYAALDIYTCGSHVDPEKAVRLRPRGIRRLLVPHHRDHPRHRRGRLEVLPLLRDLGRGLQEAFRSKKSATSDSP